MTLSSSRLPNTRFIHWKSSSNPVHCLFKFHTSFMFFKHLQISDAMLFLIAPVRRQLKNISIQLNFQSCQNLKWEESVIYLRSSRFLDNICTGFDIVSTCTGMIVRRYGGAKEKEGPNVSVGAIHGKEEEKSAWGECGPVEAFAGGWTRRSSEISSKFQTESFVNRQESKYRRRRMHIKESPYCIRRKREGRGKGR